jgi:putative ABC transport system permease protein
VTGAALLATWRIARRGARRARARSALVVAMVALPIAGLCFGLVVIRTAAQEPEERVRQILGSADLLVDPYGRRVDVDEVREALPADARVTELRTAFGELALGGEYVQLDFHEPSVPIDRPPVAPMFSVLEGRAPRAPGEAAIPPRLAEDLGLAIGDTLRLEALGLDLRITGTVVDPEDLSFPIVVLGPGTLGGVERRSSSGGHISRPQVDAYLVELPRGAPTEEVAVRGASVLSRSFVRQVAARETHEGLVTGFAFSAAALALLATGLIAGAAFAVGARRQLRALGLLAAAGGEPRHTAATVLLAGTTLGLAGSLAGAALGVAAAFALAGRISELAGRMVGPVEVPWIRVAGAVALGTLAATFAAAGPARSAARLSVLQALAERFGEPRRPGRLAAGGLVVSGLGAAVTATGAAEMSDPWLGIGLVVMIGGFLVAIPLLVTWVGRVAGRLPTVLRLAAREVARHGRRTGAALAAAAVALAVPVGVAGVTLSQDALERRTPYLANDQVLLWWFDRPGPWDPQLLAAVREAVPGSLLVPVVTAGIPPGREGRGRPREVYVRGPAHHDEQGTWWASAPLAIGGPELLRALGAAEGIPALLAGRVVGIGPDVVAGGTVPILLQPSERVVMELPAAEAGATGIGAVAAGYVISPQRAAELGLVPRWPHPEQYLLRAPHPLAEEELARIKRLVSDHQGLVAAGAADYYRGEGALRAAVAGVSTLLALAIVGVVVALVGTEARRERAILVAVGAGPRTRRLVAGAVAFLLALLAGALAVPAGFAPVLVFRVAQARGHPIVVPWSTIAVVLLAAPLLAGAAAALVSRQPRAAQLLRPIA